MGSCHIWPRSANSSLSLLHAALQRTECTSGLPCASSVILTDFLRHLVLFSYLTTKSITVIFRPITCEKKIFFLNFKFPSKESTCQCRETQVPSLVQEDPTGRGATKPVHHSSWASALESGSCWSPCTTAPERVLKSGSCLSPAPQLLSRVLESGSCWSLHTRVCVLQQEKPPQWEAHAQQRESSSRSLQPEKSPHSGKDPTQPKIQG